jgi:hypothetical protein
MLQKHQDLKVGRISQNYTKFNGGDFSFLAHITHFKYQKIQIEVPYNSSKSGFFLSYKIPAIGSLYGCNSLLSLGTASLIKPGQTIKG